MQTEELLRKCIEVCEDRKAVDVRAYDVRGQSTLADYYLFASGNSAAQIRAIVNNVEKAVRANGASPRGVEGVPESRWVLLDCRDFLVHVFHPEARSHYNVEALLEGAPLVYPQPESA